MASNDEQRSRRLLFATELRDGEVRESQLARREVREAVMSRRVPSVTARAYQRRLLRRGRLGHAGSARRFADARRAVLGDAAGARARVLVRSEIEGAPGTDVPYLLAVAPEDAAAREERLADLRRDGVTFALDARGLSRVRPKAWGAALDRGLEQLAAVAVRPSVALVGRLPFRAWDALSERFDVVTGGPASVGSLGFHDTPLFRRDAVWAPAYADGPGSAVQAAVDQLDGGAWVPVTVTDGAIEGLRGSAWDWEDFLDAVRRSR